MKSASFRALKPDTTEAPSSWWRISWEWRAGVSSFCCPMCIINFCCTGRESSGSIGKVGRRFIGLACSAAHFAVTLVFIKRWLFIQQTSVAEKVTSLSSCLQALVDITCTLLLLNPDFTTAWNVRYIFIMFVLPEKRKKTFCQTNPSHTFWMIICTSVVFLEILFFFSLMSV